MKPLILIGGYLSSPGDFARLAEALAAPPYAYRVFIAPIGRAHWTIASDQDRRPLLAILRATLAQALAETGAQQAEILAHGVGGTLARMFLGETPYLGEVYGGRRYVNRLITLGTPHHSNERRLRRTVGFVNTHYPGVFYDDVRYVSVVGRSVQGDPHGRGVARWASHSYAAAMSPEQARAWGDGSTSLECAALRGAEYLVVPGLHHSPLHGRPWYGDPAALPRWGRVLGPSIQPERC